MRWMELLPESIVLAITTYGSDHSPLVIKIPKDKKGKGERAFDLKKPS